MTDTGLPASIEAAWGLREQPTRGPKRALSLARIVTAAVAVADAEGLDALSMSRVAAELGTSAMSLYRYISAKDELLTLMVDAIFEGIVPAPAADWRTGVRDLAWACQRALHAHPWAVRIPISGPPLTPHQLRWLEAGLAALRETPLSAAEKMSSLLMVSGLARNDATLASEIGDDKELMVRYATNLARVLTADAFPELIGVMHSGMMEQDDEWDEEFAWSLERVLDGLATLIATKNN
ncbi:TetR/AcrR family transcriptional regulator [Actinokineospora inagensis]|uniref:TetR/AcrR family transcriptional regulator n=1 Tax=Actinokineospora inagensis TaxID=103730 RepID=UPI00041B453D|nr:TetR/AcrR family transcriptional regulator [Actinokineospora inagensis]